MVVKFKNRCSSFDIDSSMFVSGFIMGTILLFCLSTIGFNINFYNYFIVGGLALLISNSSVVYRILQNVPDSVGLDAVQTCVLFITVLVISFLPSWATQAACFVLAIAGFACYFFLLLLSDKSKFQRVLSWIFLPGIVSIWIFGMLMSNGLHHPLWLERLSQGWMHIDQLFHASISQMIMTYGIPSTGLNGTPYMPYHFASHAILGRLSAFTRFHVLDGYNTIYPILIISLYLRSIFFTAKDLAKVIFSIAWIETSMLVWACFTILIVGLLPNPFTYQNFAMWESWLVSESYNFSLLFLNLTISTGLAIVTQGKRKWAYLYSVLFALIYLLAAFSKISVAFVGGTAILYCIFRSGRWRDPVIWMNAASIIVITYVAMKVTSEVGQTSPLQTTRLLHFVKVWSNQNWRVVFIPVYYLFVLIYVAFRMSSARITSLNRLTQGIRSKKLLDIEFLIMISILGFGPAAILVIGGGSAAYFTDIQSRIALIFIFSWIISQHTKDYAVEEDARVLKSFLRRNTFLVLLVIVIGLNNVYLKVEEILNKNLAFRGALLQFDSTNTKFYGAYSDFYTYMEGDVADYKQKLWEVGYHARLAVAKTDSYRYYNWLLDSCSQIKDKSQFYISVPKSNTTFWKGAHYSEKAIPFMLPALTGMAMANGLPENYKTIVDYGYLTYHNLELNPTECASEPGKKVLRVNPNDFSLRSCE